MSESSIKGKSYELRIAKITHQKLRLEVKRDGRSGAGAWHKEDLRDRYKEIPLAIECKNQATLKPKEWFRDAADKASFGQMPAVVFPMDTEDLVLMRYTDVLQLIRERMDYVEQVATMRKPVVLGQKIIKTPEEMAADLQRVASRHAGPTCPNEHIADEYGFCMQKGCKFSRGYKAPKTNGGKGVKERRGSQENNA